MARAPLPPRPEARDETAARRAALAGFLSGAPNNGSTYPPNCAVSGGPEPFGLVLQQPDFSPTQHNNSTGYFCIPGQDVTQPEGSPDGSEILATAGVHDGPTHIIELADSTMAPVTAPPDAFTQLTSGDPSTGDPDWSPDQTQIAYDTASTGSRAGFKRRSTSCTTASTPIPSSRRQPTGIRSLATAPMHTTERDTMRFTHRPQSPTARRTTGARTAAASVALCLLTAVTALALAAPSAGASTRHRPPRGFHYGLYSISFRGSGSYATNSGDLTSKATFHWNVVYHPLFYVATPGAPVGTAANPMFSTGGGDWSIVNDSQDAESCDKHDSLALAPHGAIVGGVGHGGALNLTLTPGFDDFTTLGGSSGPGACDTTDFWHDWVIGFSHVGSAPDQDVDPLTAFVDLSPSELRAGREIIKVSNVTLAAPSLQVPSDCGSGDGTTCTQSFSWTGTVTVAKINTTPQRHHHRHHGRH